MRPSRSSSTSAGGPVRSKTTAFTHTLLGVRGVLRYNHGNARSCRVSEFFDQFWQDVAGWLFLLEVVVTVGTLMARVSAISL